MDAITLETTPEEHAAIARCFRGDANSSFAWLLSELSRGGINGAAPGNLLHFGNSVAESDDAWAFCAAIDTATLAMALGATAEAIDERPRLFAKIVHKYAADIGRPVMAGQVDMILRDGRWGSAGDWVAPVAVERLREALRATPVWDVMQALLRRTGHPLPALRAFAFRLRGPDNAKDAREAMQ